MWKKKCRTFSAWAWSHHPVVSYSQSGVWSGGAVLSEGVCLWRHPRPFGLSHLLSVANAAQHTCCCLDSGHFSLKIPTQPASLAAHVTSVSSPKLSIASKQESVLYLRILEPPYAQTKRTRFGYLSWNSRIQQINSLARDLQLKRC